MEFQQNAFDFQIKNTQNIYDSIIKTITGLSKCGKFKAVIRYNKKDMVLNNNVYEINTDMFDVLLEMMKNAGVTFKTKTKLFSRNKVVTLSWEPANYVQHYQELLQAHEPKSDAVSQHTESNEDTFNDVDLEDIDFVQAAKSNK